MTGCHQPRHTSGVMPQLALASTGQHCLVLTSTGLHWPALASTGHTAWCGGVGLGWQLAGALMPLIVLQLANYNLNVARPQL